MTTGSMPWQAWSTRCAINEQIGIVSPIIFRGPHHYFGDVGWGGGDAVAPGISSGPEYSGNGGAGERGGW